MVEDIEVVAVASKVPSILHHVFYQAPFLFLSVFLILHLEFVSYDIKYFGSQNIDNNMKSIKVEFAMS